MLIDLSDLSVVSGDDGLHSGGASGRYKFNGVSDPGEKH